MRKTVSFIIAMLLIISFAGMPVSAVAYSQTFGSDRVTVELLKVSGTKAQASTVVTGANGGRISVSVYTTYVTVDGNYKTVSGSGSSYQNGVTASSSIPSGRPFISASSYHTATYYGFTYHLTY